MNYLIDRRDVDFILKEQIRYERLLELPPFKDLSPEIFDMILDQSLKFAQQEIAPLNAAGDREGCRFDGKGVTTPKGFKELYKKFADSGFIGLDVSPAYGGQGLPMTLVMPVYEFFNGASVSFTMYPELTRGAAHLIETFGSPELKRTYVENMYRGRWAGTMCLTESQAGSAVGDLETTAIPQPDGSYKIKGTKMFISSGDHDLTENIVHLVLARIQGEPEHTIMTLSLFAVPKFRVNPNGSLGRPNGVKTVNLEKKMGIKAQATCLLTFGDSDDCIGYLVGEPSAGMRQMVPLMAEARLLCGMQGLAIAGTAYEHALRYARERVQGQGKTIIHYPDVRRMLMIQKSFVEGLRAMFYHAGFYIDLARYHPDRETRNAYQGLCDLLIPMCKAYGSDIGFRMTELAMQTYGGYGYLSDYPIEQYMRDIKISSIFEGTNGIQALDFLGRIPMRGGQPVRQFYAMIDKFVAKNKDHPNLKEELALLKGALEDALQTALIFMEMKGKGDLNYPLLHAAPFLHMFSTVVVGYYLLEQAVIADGKAATARFYAHQILPTARAAAESIRSGDRSAIEIAL
jgi:alkylation response protein AidB-like acyl-CoA dehydrogenase